MNQLREIPEGECTRRIYRENAYIILSVMCSLSESLNLSENSKKICRNTQEKLRRESGEEDIKFIWNKTLPTRKPKAF